MITKVLEGMDLDTVRKIAAEPQAKKGMLSRLFGKK